MKKDRPKLNWISDALNPAHKGLLHETLGIPLGQKIPLGKLKSASKGNTPTAKRARLALTLRKMH